MKEERPLSVAVVGAGRMGSHQIRILSEIPGVSLDAVVEPDGTRAAEAARKFGVEVVGEIDDLPNGITAATVAAPTSFHHECAGKLLDRGIHCLVEKPITISLEEARDLLDKAEAGGLILRVGHVERFNGAVLAARDHITHPRFIEVHRLSPFPERSLDVGVVLDLMIHDIDLILSLVRSPVVKVDAVGASVLTGREDIANARLTFESGCVANVTASRVSAKTMRKIRIFAEDRYISIDYLKQDAVIYRKRPGSGEVLTMKDIERIRPRVRKTEPLRLELENFVASCGGKGGGLASGEEGKNALEIALEIGRAIEEGSS